MSFADYAKCMRCRTGNHEQCGRVVRWPGAKGVTPCRCLCRKDQEKN